MNAASISSQDRMRMVMMGLSANNPEHIQRYFNNKGVDRQEVLENVAYLVGEDVFKRTNLGHAKESANVNVENLVGTDGAQVARKSNPARDYRASLMEDMEDYAPQGQYASRTIESERLLNLGSRQQQQQRPQRQQQRSTIKESPENLTLAKKQGYQLGIAYLNAFIVNIKKPASQNRQLVYNNLQKIMQYEQKLSGSPKVLSAFRQGVAKAETELYAKMKS